MAQIKKIIRKDLTEVELTKALRSALSAVEHQREKIERLTDRVKYLQESRDFWCDSSTYWNKRNDSLIEQISKLENKNGKSE
jgi:hypothetical protein